MEGGPAGMAGHARLSFVPAPLPPLKLSGVKILFRL